MCGILGVVFGERPADFEGATDCLAHRGPDSQADLVKDGVYLGHSRLSIIDHAGGGQPMVSRDGQLIVVYNGEIYNFRELRAELESRGHYFHTQSDTEVILSAYEEWGKCCVKRFRGMFAFCVADYRKRKLLLARDHIGIKPLVYTFLGGRFAFASEIQGLLQFRWVKEGLAPDLQGMCDSIRFPYTSAPQSCYHGIRKLPPAHYLEVELNEFGLEVEPFRYWSMPFDADESLCMDDCVEMVDATLRESVKAHMVADVPFGAFLSGGLDSTLVVSYMAEILECPVKTFCIGFDGGEFDERSYASEAAQLLNTEHFDGIVHDSAMDLLPKLIQHYGEPFGDPSAIPTWHVSKLAREQVPMVLTGDGGDEFFAGYWNHHEWLRNLDPKNHPRKNRHGWKNLVRPFLEKIAPFRFIPDPPYPQTPILEDLIELESMFPTSMLRRLLRPEISSAVDFIPSGFRDSFKEDSALPSLSCIQNVDINNYLPNDILNKVDIASMMHGLETRTPLADVRVAEMAGKIPWHLLVKECEMTSTWVGKMPFRSILAKHFSKKFIDRPKMGFGIPVNEWLFGQSTAADLRERLTGRNARILAWVNLEGVKDLIERRKGYQVWHLLVLEEWLEQNNF